MKHAYILLCILVRLNDRVRTMSISQRLFRTQKARLKCFLADFWPALNFNHFSSFGHENNFINVGNSR